MMEYDMKRNGSGYYDETPVKSGVFNGPQPGEIWESNYGKEFLILKNHDGGFCTTLALNDNQHPDTIEVVSRTVRYTNPGMVGYSFNNNFSQYIKNVSEEDFLSIMEAVGERLGVTIKVSRAGTDDVDKIINEKSMEIAQQKSLLEVLRTTRDALERELEETRLELRKSQQSAGNADVVAAVKAEMYENLYKDLLQKCLARGEG